MRRATSCLVFVVIVLATALSPAAGQSSRAVTPFESRGARVERSPIDALVTASLGKRRIEPAILCSDEVFIRRVYLDVIGTLPEAWEVRRFLRQRSPDKRPALIESLFARTEFADYWTLKWCDVLRVKAEFPINLWPNAVQAYRRWIHDAVRSNMAYDRFVRQLLTSSGSNFRNPPVNFYRAIQGTEPDAIARAVALTFLGARTERWPQSRRRGLAVFFSRVAYKRTAEWKEEIVHLDPAPAKPLRAVFPDGSSVRIAPTRDPRTIFADWLVAPKNRWFAANIVNRIWSWLLGRGLVHEPDDFRPNNPAVHPRVLAFLVDELRSSNYDLRHIYRLILNSRTYQQSPIPRTRHRDAEALFAHYPVRRLDAEVLIDALCQITGTRERYASAIPEPFTFIPEVHRTIRLADGSITSTFLEMFGRPARDTGLESERRNDPTDAQRLHLLNSTHVQRKIERGWKVRQLIRGAKGNRRRLATAVYLAVLSRRPTRDEHAVVKRHYQTRGNSVTKATHDLVWTLINTKEFLYRH